MGWTVKPRYHAKRGYWYYHAKVDGKKRQVYLAKTEADAWMRFRELTQSPAGSPPRTVTAAVKEWLTVHKPGDRWYRDCLGAWVESCGMSTTVAEVACDDDHLKRYLNALTASGKAPDTSRSYVKLAYRVLDWCAEKGWIASAPKKPPLPRSAKRPRDVPLDKLTRIMQSLPPRPRALALFIVETACRPSEAYNLRWRDVDIDKRVAVFDEHKTDRTGKRRVLRLTDTSITIIKGIKDDTSPSRHLRHQTRLCHSRQRINL